MQDVITYDQKLFQNITDKNISQYVYDSNYKTILRTLRDKPKTVEELVASYERIGNPKSLMTVYRYLRHLINAGLIVEAGKRIITDDENRNKTLTLYCTSAIMFYDDSIEDDLTFEKSTIRKREVEVYGMLIKLLTGKEPTLKCINFIINKVYNKGRSQLAKIIEQSEKDLNKYLVDFGIMMTNTMIVHIGWMALILDEEIREELLNCT